MNSIFKTPSSRAAKIDSFLAMELLARARQLEADGRDIVHMELGEPDRPAPYHVIEAAFRAVREGYSTYTPAQGIAELREAIAGFYMREYGVRISPERIIVTEGVSPALFLVFSALLDAGDEVVIHEPYYPPYMQCIGFLDGKVKSIKLDASAGFPIDSTKLINAVNAKTKAILLNSPSNPTGMMIDHAGLEAIAESGVTIVADEIYHRITYGVQAASILEWTDNCFVLNGFSKVFGMTGWRLGWIICPDEFVDPLRKIHQNFFLSANAFVQKAGVAALSGSQDYVAETVAIYKERRAFLIEELGCIGWKPVSDPQGAFYLLVDVSNTGLDGITLADKLLDEAGVAVTPGIDFGESAANHVRFCYATGIDRIEEGVKRIKKWTSAIR